MDALKNDIPSPQKTDSSIQKEGDKKYIYYAEWDEWGRAARDCDGWGLCNFADCWNCEPGDAKIVLNGDDHIYEMIIELNSGDPDEQEAINQNKPLYVDSDIVHTSLPDQWKTVTVPHGVYPFNSNVGLNGGYIIDLEVR